MDAAQVLNEGEPCDDQLSSAVGALPPHRSKSVFEAALVGLDPVIGLPFHVVP